MKTNPLFSSRQIILFFAALFMLSVSAFADYPPVLVISGTAYPQTSSGDTFSEYDTGNGVLVIYGATGGEADWGPDETTAFNAPTATGTWDGGLTLTVTGQTILVPQVLVYYPTVVTPVAMQGYDGNPQSPIGSGTDATSGDFMVAYNGLPSGYIFNFGDGLPIYRYQAGPGPVVINTDYGWPPSSLFSFPSQLFLNGQELDSPLDSTSYTEGFDSGGYWSNETYSGTGGTGDLHIFIDSSGTTGTAWGTVNGVDVYATWDSSTGQFTADAGLGFSLSAPGSTPTYGPPGMEFNGVFLPFRYNDTNGSDVYSDLSGTRVIIDSSWSVTAVNNYETISAYYDGHYFHFGPWWYDLAGVTADGTQFYTNSDDIGFTVSTSGWDPGAVTVYDLSIFGYYRSFNWDYSLYRADGTAIFSYMTAAQDRADRSLIQFTGSPFYCVNTNYVEAYLGSSNPRYFDLTNGWPASDYATPPAFPAFVYVDNIAYGLTGTDTSFMTDEFNGGDVIVTGHYNNGLDIQWFLAPGGSADFSMASGGSIWLDTSKFFNAGTLALPEGTFYSSEWQVPVSFTAPGNPKYGPPKISYDGENLNFVGGDASGNDLYADQYFAVQVTIDSGSNVVMTSDGTWDASVSGVFNGTYNASNYQFSLSGMLAQDADYNLLGTAQGLTMQFVSSPYQYGSGYAQSVLLGDGSVLNGTNTNVYDYAINGAWGVKIAGVPKGSLFTVAYEDGGYSSPIYRNTATGSNDFNLTMDSGNNWPATNIYPAQLYVNGYYASLDASTEQTGGGPSSFGGVSYHVEPTGETISIAWTMSVGSAFSATLSGSFGAFPTISGTWDGANLFGGLPTGLVITVDPPPTVARHGSPDVQWNGIDLAFDPVASSVSGSNPQGLDVYHDTMGLGLSATVGSDGSVTLYKPDGSQYTGTYNPATYQYDISGQTAGSVLAVNNQGQVLVPTVPVGGLGGGGAGTNTGALGNFDIQGNVLSLGSWTLSSGGTMNGLSLVYMDASGGQPSLLSFMAARQSMGWIWSHADTDGGSSQVTMMQLDPTSRLMLSGTANPSTPTIILDPNGKSHIEPQGDLDMGVFTAHP